VGGRALDGKDCQRCGCSVDGRIERDGVRERRGEREREGWRERGS